MRIAKYISVAGVCSRRQAESLIEKGYIKVNKKPIASPVFFVQDKDLIEIKGQKPLVVNMQQQEQKDVKFYAFNKPTACICSEKDEQGRKTIYDIIPKNLGRLLYVGRLDYNTSGLLLLTNSGEYKRKLELPNSNIERIYKAKINKELSQKDLSPLTKGITFKGVKYRPMKVKVLETGQGKSWVEVKITEGKNREVRNAFEYLGSKVIGLVRTQYGNVKLDNLKTCEIKPVDFKL